MFPKIIISFAAVFFLSLVSLKSKDLFFDFKADRPLFLFLQAGLPGNDDKAIEIAENTEFNASWNISGALIFSSFDKPAGKRFSGISASRLTSINTVDWSKIHYRVKLAYRQEGEGRQEKYIIEGNFNDVSVKKTENDPFNADDSSYVRDYKFSILLKDTSYRFTMPISPATYKMNVEISYPVSVWRKINKTWKQIPVGRMSSKTPEREIKVLDMTPPEIILEKGMEKSGEKCTSGDPIPDNAAKVTLTVNDNNPNADISLVTLESNNQLYMFPVKSREVNFDEESQTRFTGRFEFKIPNRKGNILKAPRDGSDLEYQFVASDSSSNAGIFKSSIGSSDNDPPDVKFIFNDISGVIVKDPFDPIGKKGQMEIDITDLNTRTPLYVDKFEAPDPEPVILKTNNIIIRQNTRVFFQAFPRDNADPECKARLNGQIINKEGKRFIFTDSSKTETVLQVNDSNGNQRKIIIPVSIRKMHFNTSTLSTDR